ncbi:BURP domain protein RD22-like isoform X1 [Coffea eugenioides]|uniref:BURP domain protein RD22-like isoform X1 n=1 Tax=Coffea eugenioides TaxID=49369 RepID=UPI000F607B47|nr:BURP domain protein RD22-like isoform X1 [Coffea eugenioides]
MEFLKLLYFLSFLFLGVGANHADLEAYWKSELPNTPMPKAVRDLLKGGKLPERGNFRLKTYDDGCSFKHYCGNPTEDELHIDPKVKVFFLKMHLNRGSSMNMKFVESVKSPTAFLPRQVANSIPFSSKSVPEILNKYSLNPQSQDARIIKETIAECEVPAMKGEDKYCATSLESMVDFTTSKLGKDVLAISNEAQKTDPEVQKYGIVSVSKLNNNDKEIVSCHRQNYFYAVFYCHTTQNTDAYMVNLVGADGAKVKAVAVCHRDTSAWNPKHLAFQLLKVKPGTVPICHFLPEDHIVWVPKH